MITALFLLSFGTVLYTLVVFKLLSFFIMPSLFFDLLFIGFPIGALLGASVFKVSTKSFLWTIGLLQVAICFSTYAVLFAHNFSYLRVHLFEVEVSQLIVTISIFALLFLPFFVAYGLCEYIGYQIGRIRFKSKMHAVYALYLFGAALAYLLSYWLLPFVGVTKLILMAFLITAVVGLIIAQGRLRLIFIFQASLMIYGMTLSGLESNFLRLYKGISPASTAFFEARNFKTVYQQWGKYSLNEILQSPDGQAYYGFYNDFLQWEYYPKYGYHKPSLGTIPILLVEPDSKKVIIGSGGGRQVRFATASKHSNITAVEIEPAVIDAVRNSDHLLDEFEQVYDQPGVQVTISEGRKFLEGLEEAQDLIYLPSVGGYPQMMLEPGNLIRTHEAYQLVTEKLADDGLFAIWYPAGLDSKGVLTDQYVSTLLALNMTARAYRNNEEFLILAKHGLQTQLPTHEELMDLMVNQYIKVGGSLHTFPIDIIPAEYAVTTIESFQPVLDDRPYLGGNLSHIFSFSQIYQLYGFGGILLLTLGLTTMWLIRRKADPKIPDRSYASTALLSFLLGANFLLVEHHLVFALFKIHYVFQDALITGAVIFLVLSGLGSMISNTSIRNLLIQIAICCYVLVILVGFWLPDWLVLALMLVPAIATGTFFPLLFEKGCQKSIRGICHGCHWSRFWVFTGSCIANHLWFSNLWGVDRYSVYTYCDQ